MAIKKKTTSKPTKGKKISSKASRSLKSTPKIKAPARPPVVTFMGHVDHGKTSLLDAIRKSNQVQKEFGGITQHIGAYQVEQQGGKITFIDTPGHAAFAKMRAQGAQVTDLVVLVVAADDGVKPQTREALSHIRSSKAPFLVAINKTDLPEANVEKVKGQLAEEGVVVESYGGDIVAVEVSAKTGKNLDQLLEMIILVAEMQNLKSDPHGKLQAVIIETHQDKRKGITATLLVKQGTLLVGSEYQIQGQKLKIRAMQDASGKKLTEAGPSTPVEILGFKQLPLVGQIIGEEAEQLQPHHNQVKMPVISQKLLSNKEGADEESDGIEEEVEKQTVRIIIKADVAGVLEAITSNLSEEVEIISKGLGEVGESDVLLAQATSATVIAFNVKVSTSATKLAEIEKVKILTYNIIYKLFEDLEKQVLKILEPTIDEEVVGEAKVIAEFMIHDERIAGCKVIQGEIRKNLSVHLKRNGEIIKTSKIKSIKRGKEDIESVKKDSECGISFKPKIDFKINDAIISYRKIDED